MKLIPLSERLFLFTFRCEGGLKQKVSQILFGLSLSLFCIGGEGEMSCIYIVQGDNNSVAKLLNASAFIYKSSFFQNWLFSKGSKFSKKFKRISTSLAPKRWRLVDFFSKMVEFEPLEGYSPNRALLYPFSLIGSLQLSIHSRKTITKT